MQVKKAILLSNRDKVESKIELKLEFKQISQKKEKKNFFFLYINADIKNT